MHIAGKTAAAPDMRETPATRKRFAGRGALAGLLDATAPKTMEQLRDQETLQIISSRIILEGVMMAVTARSNIANYKAALIGGAEKIAVKRRERGAPTEAKPEAEARPGTKQGVLLAALRAMGLNARITGEVNGAQSTKYTISCDGVTSFVLLTHDVMKTEDPVAQAVKELGVFCLGQKGEEARGRVMTQRITTRPPPGSAGVDEKELEKRMVSFDGIIESPKGSIKIFTYLAKETGTSFSIPCEFSGNELLDSIDERIEEIHRKYDVPFPAALMEQRAAGRKTKAYLTGVPDGLLTVAKTLDYLAADCIGMGKFVPEEYREAFDALKKLPRPRTAFLSGEEMQELAGALDDLDHPIHTILRQTYGPDPREVMLDASAQEETRALLTLSDSVAIDVCGIALGNLGEAYSLVSGDDFSALAGPSDIKKDYFRVAYTLRARINEFIAEGLIEVEG
jgi:hypothetical protein